MQLLGKSLEELHKSNNSKFSLKTVCMIAIQIVVYSQIKARSNRVHP